jgi:hypothetical protein
MALTVAGPDQRARLFFAGLRRRVVDALTYRMGGVVRARPRTTYDSTTMPLAGRIL